MSLCDDYMNKPTTVNELNKRWWYRLLKVVYVFGYLVVVGVAGAFVFGVGDLGFGAWTIFWGVVVFELIRRAFYYVITGTMKPSRE